MVNDTTIKICIESDLIYLPILRKTVRAICSSVIHDEEIFQDIDLALTEALSNVIDHAYRNEPGYEIQILVTLYPEEVLLQIIDSGLKNPKTDKPSLQLDFDLNKVESIPESGRGLFLIHQLMDKVAYKSEDGKNILTMLKRIKRC